MEPIFTPEQFKEQYQKIPEILQSALFDEQNHKLISQAISIAKLESPDQFRVLADLVIAVLIRILKPTLFKTELIQRASVSQAQANILDQIIQNNLFSKYRSLLEAKSNLEISKNLLNTTNEKSDANIIHPLDQILKIREQTKIAQQLRRASKQIALSESIQKSQPNISPKPDFNQPSSQIPLNQTEIKSANPQKPENTIPSSEPLPPRVVNLKNTDASKLIEAMKKPTVTSPVLEKMKELQNIPLSFEKKPQKETDKLNSLKPLTTDKTKIISSPVENLKPEIQKKKIGSSEESTIFSEFPQPSEPLPSVSPPPLVKYQKIQKEGPAFDLPLENQKTLETNKEDSNRVVFDYTKIQFQKTNEKTEENLKTSENSKNNQFSSPLLNKNEPKIKGNIVDLS